MANAVTISVIATDIIAERIVAVAIVREVIIIARVNRAVVVNPRRVVDKRVVNKNNNYKGAYAVVS
jgi:hypothetical protein